MTLSVSEKFSLGTEKWIYDAKTDLYISTSGKILDRKDYNKLYKATPNVQVKTVTTSNGTIHSTLTTNNTGVSSGSSGGGGSIIWEVLTKDKVKDEIIEKIKQKYGKEKFIMIKPDDLIKFIEKA